jgi:hypothetical protein
MTARELKTILQTRFNVGSTVRTVVEGDVIFIVVSTVNNTIPSNLWQAIYAKIDSEGYSREYVFTIMPQTPTDVVGIKFTTHDWNDIVGGVAIPTHYGDVIRRGRDIFSSIPMGDIPFPMNDDIEEIAYTPHPAINSYQMQYGAEPQNITCSGACGRELDTTNEPVYWGQVENEVYCATDYKELYVRCKCCGQGAKKDSFKDCDICDRGVCKLCLKIHSCWKVDKTEQDIRRKMYKTAVKRKIPLNNLENPMHDFEKKFLQGNPEIKNKFIKHDRFVGVEIEVEKGKAFGLNMLLPQEVGISHDGSLDQGGIEIQTPPASLNELETIVTNTCETLRSRNWQSTVKCGLHIHLDASDFKDDSKKIINVIKTFYAIEDMIFSILPPSRWVSKYCQRLSKDYLYNSFNGKAKADVAWYKEESMRLLEGRKSRKYDKARYYGINIHSLFYNGTLELRYHSGTVNEKKILYWTAFALNVLDYALNRYDDKVIKKIFDMETSVNKFNYMCDVLELPYEVEKYLIMRASKFNTNFAVKFNQGKEARDKEKKLFGKINKKIQDKITEIKPKIVKDVRKLFKDSGIDYPERHRTRDFVQAVDERVDQQLRIAFPNQYPAQQTEGGFIKDEEVNTITNYINQGRTLERENPEDGEREE